MNVGETRSFSYTGGMQSFTVDTKGVYKLEVSGAGAAKAKGGYAVGYKMLDVGDVIYICVGQRGSYDGSNGNRYNGGRDISSGSNPSYWYGCYSGGGCTHMATRTGELASLSGNRDSVLIVAGGAGGVKGNVSGGAGGGSSGGAGSNAAGGTQTGGAGFGYGGYADVNRGGGGGGWYGGYNSSTGGGGGGSGYIGGVPSFTHNGTVYSPSTTTGSGAAVNANGSAKITFVAKGNIPVSFNGTTLEKIIFNGVEVKSLIVNGVKLFMERMKRRMQAWNTSTRAGSPSSRPI